jgi:hypothetical protein
MIRYREYIEWDSAAQAENELTNINESNSPFDDPTVRKRMIEIIIRAATVRKDPAPRRRRVAVA